MLWAQQLISPAQPKKYLCGKINEKARAHRPQSVVGSRTRQHATDLELSSFGGSDQPFASLSQACRRPAAALGAAFLPTRPCARTPKSTMPGALSRSCTLPLASLGFDGRLLRKSKRTAWHGIFSLCPPLSMVFVFSLPLRKTVTCCACNWSGAFWLFPDQI